jgi:putative molybdopterin biosynthesis protein
MASQGDTLRCAREARGLTQLNLARRAGISRQALGAIETGTYQPGVTVALALARELGDTVEGLFSGEPSRESRRIRVSWTDNEKQAPKARRSVALARVGGKVVAVEQPAVRLTLSPTGGMLEGGRRREAEVDTFRTPEEIDSTLLIAGCDPSVAMLSDWLARSHSLVSAAALPCSSSTAIRALLDGRAHAAGVHLRDPARGARSDIAVQSSSTLPAGNSGWLPIQRIATVSVSLQIWREKGYVSSIGSAARGRAWRSTKDCVRPG